MATPFLRWAGSKRKLVPKLRQYWPGNPTTYLEAFAGSACLFFALEPKNAILNDINPHLINCYRSIQQSPEQVFNAISMMNVSKEFYLHMRKRAFLEKDPIQKAANFIYLNRNCFNGLYRVNRSGEFNVPFSASRTPSLPSLDSLLEVSRNLKSVKLRCLDFETFLRRSVRRNSFVYIDPPYAVGNRRIFRQYAPDQFGLDDIARLADILVSLDSRGATFLLSYADCREAREAFGCWKTNRTLTRRNIAGFAGARRKSAELLVTNTEAKYD